MTRGVTPTHIKAPIEALGRIVATLHPDEVPTSQTAALWSAFDRSGSDASQPTDQAADASRQAATSARKRHKRKRRDPSNPTYLTLLRIDFAALQRGHTRGDETCEIAGVGPIPVTRARQLLGDAVIKLIASKGQQVVNVTHYGRKPSTAQRMALLWSQPACTVQGCNQTFAQIDHRVEWHKTRHTRLDQLDRLCAHHHRLKTNQGWTLTAGSGKRALVPPTDPRHPNQQKPSIPAGRPSHHVSGGTPQRCHHPTKPGNWATAP